MRPMANLVVCRRCSRHVLAHEHTCPFCATTMPAIARKVGLGGVVAASVVAAALAGCGGATPPPADGLPEDSTEVKVLPPAEEQPADPSMDGEPGDSDDVQPEAVEDKDPPPAVAMYAPPPTEH